MTQIILNDFHFDSVFNVHSAQNQAILLHELHRQRMHAQISSKSFKVLQISVRPNMCFIL